MKTQTADKEDTNSEQEERQQMINKSKDDKTEDGLTTGLDAAQAKKKKYIKWGIIGGIILIVVILAIVLPITLTKKGGDNPTPPGPPPGPFVPGTYNPYGVDQKDLITSPFGYSGIIKSSSSYSSKLHQLALQKLFAKNTDALRSTSGKLGVNSNGIPQSLNNNFTQELFFSMGMTKWKIAHFTLTDNNNTRYSVPEEAVPKPADDQSMRLDMLGFNLSLSPFGFSFSDPVDSSNVFVNSIGQNLVFMDKFIQMDFKLPSQRLYGFGERVREFNLQEGTWTMWAIGQNSPYDDGTGRLGVYGVHPFVLVQGKNKGDFIGLFFRNSNAQSPVITFTDDGGSILSYITTGGQVDIYFFIHGTVSDIVKSYQGYFGKPRLPPFWSMGWHQASYKWENISMVQNVSDSYANYGFPLDALYLDIPYMSNYTDFTVNETAFPNLTTYVDSLHKNGTRLVVIVDAGISADDTSNPYYTLGNQTNVFIKSGKYLSDKYSNNLLMQVWSNKTVFVDWFNNNSIVLWGQGLIDLYNKTHYDGIWIDMNEPTGFTHGELVPEDAKNITTTPENTMKVRAARFLEDYYDYSWYSSLEANNQSTYDLPFIPRFTNKDTNAIQNFDNWTLSLNATHPGLNNEIEYNLHSLYGHMMANKTYYFLAENLSSPTTDKRPFILTRSTFTSTGKYASHWLGDNYREWRYLNYSIAGIMNMNMFGIPHVGADVCGFFGESRDDEMCSRWIQLATFYPFARLHYDRSSDPNEPYLINGTYGVMAKRAMLDRYQYLRHVYTCLFEASQNGGTCFDPLFYYYPQDDNLYQEYESSFMVGGAIKVTPVLTKLEDNQTTFNAYFPAGNWIDLNNPGNVIVGNQTVQLSTTQNSVHAHLKPGSIISYQANDGTILNTDTLIAQPISLLINRDENNQASGRLFLDKGEKLSDLSNGNYEYYSVQLQANNSIILQNNGGNIGSMDHTLKEIKLLNATDYSDELTNGVSFSCYLDSNMQAHQMISEYVAEELTLKLTPQEKVQFNNIHAIHFGGKNDINLCDMSSFGYTIKDGIIPPLSVNNISIELQPKGSSLPNLMLSMRVLEGDIVNIKWTWAAIGQNDKRIPREVPDEFITTTNATLSTKTLDQFVEITSNSPFQVRAFHNSNGQKVTYWKLNTMLYDEYLNWINVTATTADTDDNFKGVFGLGERANKDFFYQNGVYSMWARDSLTPDETGKLPGNNMYGTHPIYMYRHNTSAWVGVLYKLANAQDWWITNNKTAGTINLATIATGGVADIYIMKELKPDNVISKYFTLIGNPVLIPQWALGWNQCRWGYTNLTQVETVVQGYADNYLPLDVQWSDIDYLNQYRNFEFDNTSFKGLPDFIDGLHQKNMSYVPILDAGLAYRPNGEYNAFNTGKDQDVFMKINGEIFIGQVWPNDAAYPDYFANNTVSWWQSNLDSMYNDIKFDGLWEDMNEASNFCNGVCYESQRPASPVKNLLKYIPTGRDLEYKSMALDTQHANGYIQLDTHSYYGTQMVKATHEWFAKNDKRTFIIERSSFAGMGKYASRWLGDNFSQWSSMAYSVSGIMLMNMFGITMAGSDICGFILDTNLELCTKWHIVGAFYPFSRNHNNWGQISQEPYVWSGQKVGIQQRDALDVMRDAIRTKYSLVRYYYSNLFQTSIQGTGTFYKPMFFEFPDDQQQAYQNIVYNVMLGSSLKLSINPENKDITSFEYYFPMGVWCSIDGTQPLGECFNTTSADGILKTFNASHTDYQLHIRQGYIVPMQDTKNKTGEMTANVSTTADLKSWPIDLHILGQQPDSSKPNWNAQGTYLNDDGVSLNYSDKYNSYLFSASFNSQNISVKVTTQVNATTHVSTDVNCTAVNQNDYLKRIFIYNADNYQNSVKYNVNATLLDDSTSLAGNATYDDKTKILTFKSVNDLCLSTIKELLFVPESPPAPPTPPVQQALPKWFNVALGKHN